MQEVSLTSSSQATPQVPESQYEQTPSKQAPRPEHGKLASPRGHGTVHVDPEYAGLHCVQFAPVQCPFTLSSKQWHAAVFGSQSPRRLQGVRTPPAQVFPQVGPA